MSKVSRRTFMKIAAALTASGVLAWKGDKLKVEAEEIAPVIGVDPAETGGDETAIFPGLDKIITTGHIDAPFVPYYVDRTSSVFVHWDDMEDGDTWGIPHFRGFNNEREG